MTTHQELTLRLEALEAAVNEVQGALDANWEDSPATTFLKCRHCRHCGVTQDGLNTESHGKECPSFALLDKMDVIYKHFIATRRDWRKSRPEQGFHPNDLTARADTVAGYIVEKFAGGPQSKFDLFYLECSDRGIYMREFPLDAPTIVSIPQVADFQWLIHQRVKARMSEK